MAANVSPTTVRPRQFHWCVKRHKIDDVDVLERALNMYDELGWQIFDVDISGGIALVVMRAPRDQNRPPEYRMKDMPAGAVTGAGRAKPPVANLPSKTVGLTVPEIITE